MIKALQWNQEVQMNNISKYETITKTWKNHMDMNDIIKIWIPWWIILLVIDINSMKNARHILSYIVS